MSSPRSAHANDLRQAIDAATSTAEGLGLAADEAIVLRASNRFTLRLLPSEVLARVSPSSHGAAQFEVDLATRLAGTDSPVAPLDPRVPPRVYVQDGHTVTLWTYYPTRPTRELPSSAYTDALRRLHLRMRQVDLAAPHFTDRIAEAEAIVAGQDRTSAASDADLAHLGRIFAAFRLRLHEGTAPDQLLHGEPHPGNVLNTEVGALFIDLETCCRGPVEFDLAHVSDEVSARYPGIDPDLLSACRELVLAMVAAWRLDPDDRLPNGAQALRELLAALRAGPPYPALETFAGPDGTGVEPS